MLYEYNMMLFEVIFIVVNINEKWLFRGTIN